MANNNQGFVYENNWVGNEGLTPEEIEEQNRLYLEEQAREAAEAAAAAQELATRVGARQRVSNLLQRAPGTRGLINRARGRINTRRRAEAAAAAAAVAAAERQQRIRNIWRPARTELRQNLTALNYGFPLNENADPIVPATNAQLQDALSYAGAVGDADEYARILGIMEQKGASKQSILNQKIANARRIAADNLEEIYPNNKVAFLLENNSHRATILKVAALDDLISKNSERLGVALTNEDAERIATRIVNMKNLRHELDQARHKSKLPTAEQNARYAALVEGIDLGALGNGLYSRLLKNNASNKATRKIQRVYRGYKGRKEAKAKRTIRNALARWKAESEAAEAAAAATQAAEAAAAAAKVLSPAELRAARLARLGK